MSMCRNLSCKINALLAKDIVANLENQVNIFEAILTMDHVNVLLSDIA